MTMPPWLRGPTLADAWASGRNNFNLIRLLAAWLVIYGHAWAITGSAGGDLVTQLTQFKFAGGVAVDVFFFISGFLIAASLERNDTRGYLASRALRILPALIVCVSLSVFVLGPLLTKAADYWRQPHDMGLPVVEQHPVGQSLRAARRVRVAAATGGERLAVDPADRGAPLPRIARREPARRARRAPLHAAYGRSRWSRRMPSRPGATRCPNGWRTTSGAPPSSSPAPCAGCTANASAWALWPLLVLLTIAALARGTSWFHLPYFALACYGTLWLAFVPKLPVIRHNDLSYGLYLYGWPSAQLVQQFSPGGPCTTCYGRRCSPARLPAASWFAGRTAGAPAFAKREKRGSG
jgi:peptidoglycan/LPS O-acetylase OafA/YrhL